MNEQERMIEMENLLTSARAIAARHGEGTAWDRFDASIEKLRIGSITARTYRLLRGETNSAPVTETKTYPDDATAAGMASLPGESPATPEPNYGTAQRVSLADIEAEIASEHYFTARNGVFGAGEPGSLVHSEIPALGLLTFCVLVLRNGFTVTGESACASPENFSAEIGHRIARQHAIDKMWPLLGFRLRDALHELAARVPEGGE